MTKRERLNLQLLASVVLAISARETETVAEALARLYKSTPNQHEFVRSRLSIGSWFASKGYGGTAYELVGEAISYLAQQCGNKDLLYTNLVLATSAEQADKVWPQYCAWSQLLGDNEDATKYWQEVLACNDGKA